MNYNRDNGMANEKRDWVQILVAPLLIGAFGVLLTAGFAYQLNQHQNDIEDRRAKSELKLEKLRAQDAALQAYLGQMSSLLLNKDRPLSQAKEGAAVLTLARARTSTVMQTLDADRTLTVLRFLNEAGLIGKSESSISILAGADLRGAHLAHRDLSDLDLRGTLLNGANLNYADLHSADLRNADLRNVTLHNAILVDAKLGGANMSGADMTGVGPDSWEEVQQQDVDLDAATAPNGKPYLGVLD